MISSVELVADSDYQTAGKQWIGLVTGPHHQLGVALTFVGTRSGKRGERTTWTVVVDGLYKVRSTSRKGTDDRYVLVWRLGDVLVRTEIDDAQALVLARDLSDAEIRRVGREVEIADTEGLLRDSEGLPQDERVRVLQSTADELGLPDTHPVRRDLVAARRVYLDRLRGSSATTPRRALEEERAKLVVRLAEIDAALGAIGAAEGGAVTL